MTSVSVHPSHWSYFTSHQLQYCIELYYERFWKASKGIDYFTVYFFLCLIMCALLLFSCYILNNKNSINSKLYKLYYEKFWKASFLHIFVFHLLFSFISAFLVQLIKLCWTSSTHSIRTIRTMKSHRWRRVFLSSDIMLAKSNTKSR